MISYINRWLQKVGLSLDFSNKLTQDISWNFVSFVVIAINGVVLSILIVTSYDSAALGLFNQVYAIFIVLSQIAVNGIHFSVLKSVSLMDDHKEAARNFSSAIILVLFTSITVIGFTFPFIKTVSNAFGSEFMDQGIKLVYPGLVLFPMNKVILAYLNAHRKMKAFAIYQGLRSVFLLVFLLFHIAFIKMAASIPVIFSLSEGLLFLILLPVTLRNFTFKFKNELKALLLSHFKFGIRATGGNLLLELNSKVDILILGLFVSDSQVGIYSFAALFIEGFMQLPMIIRNNINPILTKKYFKETRESFNKFTKSVIRYSYLIFVPIGLIGIALFPIIGIFKTDFAFSTAWLYFSIILLGLLTGVGFFPLFMVFSQTGKPGTQSIVLLLTFCVLTGSVLLFTSLFKTVGAAIGVSVTYVIQAVIIAVFLKTISKQHPPIQDIVTME